MDTFILKAFERKLGMACGKMILNTSIRAWIMFTKKLEARLSSPLWKKSELGSIFIKPNMAFSLTKK
jgi:uncharacterized membrane protein required for colicin V production